MINESVNVKVNPAGTPLHLLLDRDALWVGLVTKAENAVDFVEPITACKVIERNDRGFIREVELSGKIMHEQIILEPKTSVIFERLDGPMSGTIENRVGGEGYDLDLTITFSLADRSGNLEAERAQGANLREGYLHTMQAIFAYARAHKAQ